jgi:uncharacterized membrane protein YfcA
MNVQSILLLLIGLGVGFVGTLIGAGGGFILVPVLLLLFPQLDPEVITSISLAVVFLNAGSGSFAYARLKRIDYKTALYFSLASMPGAILGALITEFIPKRIFDVLLGVLLVSISIFLFAKPTFKETFKNQAGKKLVRRHIEDANGQVHEYSFRMITGTAISFIVGFLSSLLGIGGGIIHVPALTSILGFPIHVATATSHLILAIMALAGTIVHILEGNLNGQWSTIIYLGAGVIFGAQAGASFSHFAKPGWIIKALAFALLLVGIRIMLW